MSKINFISHESFLADEYTKEMVYLELNVPARVCFVRKNAKNGGAFWAVANVGITKPEGKEYYPAYIQDSNFLEKDIKAFLDGRKWESKSVFESPAEKPRSMDEVANNDELPF